MLVLALDTTTGFGSCAVARDGRVVLERASDPSRPQAERLPGDVEDVLEGAGFRLSDVDVYAVAIGPGSFTGLRVGIASMQGLAFAAERPLLGVSAFDALARLASVPAGRVATWVDAWRGEVYAALYEAGRSVAAPVVAHPRTLLPELMGATTTFIGDGAARNRELIQGMLGSSARFADPVTPLLAGMMALSATEMAQAGHHPPPHAISPLYVRRPDAELARDARGR